MTHFEDNPTVLPIIKVRDHEGEPMQANLTRMREMLVPRVPQLDELLSPDAVAELALASGGVLRDLVRMVRDVCLDVIGTERATRIDLTDIDDYQAGIRNDFLHQIPRSLIGRLATVRDDPTLRGGGMDDDLARLLNIAAVLEYASRDTWFRVHPLAEYLIREPDARGR